MHISCIVQLLLYDANVNTAAPRKHEQRHLTARLGLTWLQMEDHHTDDGCLALFWQLLDYIAITLLFRNGFDN